MNYLLMFIDEIENLSSQLIFEGQRCTYIHFYWRDNSSRCMYKYLILYNCVPLFDFRSFTKNIFHQGGILNRTHQKGD